MVATEALVRGEDNEGATPAVHAARTRNYRNLLVSRRPLAHSQGYIAWSMYGLHSQTAAGLS
jgi:hypothetical protein